MEANVKRMNIGEGEVSTRMNIDEGAAQCEPEGTSVRGGNCQSEGKSKKATSESEGKSVSGKRQPERTLIKANCRPAGKSMSSQSSLMLVLL